MSDINPLYLMAGLSLLGLAPFFLMMVTSYVKIVVVTSLVRNALVGNGDKQVSEVDKSRRRRRKTCDLRPLGKIARRITRLKGRKIGVFPGQQPLCKLFVIHICPLC